MRTTNHRTIWRKMLGLMGAAALVASALACGGDEATESTATTSNPETVVTDGTTADPVEEETLTDLEYLSTGTESFAIDVHRPDGDGPFPVIVAFHGATAEGKDSSYARRMAEALAESGLVVFTPTWNHDFTLPTAADGWMESMDRASCALAYAEAHAPDYGGDLDSLATFGWSAGAHPAAWLALGHGAPGEGCVADTDPSTPDGAVLIDSEYFLHSDYFQPLFDNDPDGSSAIVAGFVDPTTWSTADEATIRLIAAEVQGASVRSIADATDPTSWLAQRDGDGSLTADLESLGALEDGQIDYIDEAELLQLRLEGAGIDATFTTASGDHSDTVGAVNDAILIPAALEATGSD